MRLIQGSCYGVFYWTTVLLLTASISQAQQSSGEQWQGILEGGPSKLRIVIQIEQVDGKWTGEAFSPDQVEQGFPLRNLVRDNSTLSFSVPMWSASFNGKIGEEGEIATGVFQQGNAKLDLVLKRSGQIVERVLTEAWKGTLVAGAQSFDFQIRILREGEREVALLDSFSENLTGLPLQLTRDEKKFDFDLTASAARYTGVFSAPDRITGQWSQRGNELSLDFEKIRLEDVRAAGMNRPQQPKQPYSWDETEVVIETRDADGKAIKLHGTLSTPRNVASPPVVVLVNGSGPQDRDCTLFGHQSFVVITDWLTKNGIATLRFDERGIGQSTGDYRTATTADFSDDVSAIVDALAERTDIDSARIGIIGHSEGGIIAPIVASRNERVKCVVLLAGPSVTGEQIIVSQTRELMKRSGLTEDLLEMQDSVSTRMIAEVLKAESEKRPVDFSAVKEEWTELMKKSVESGASAGIPEGGIEAVGMAFQTPWMKYFLGYDPATALRRLKVPTLALFGEKDFQVIPDLNVNPMRKALEESGNRDFAIETLDGLNHLFQTCEKGTMDEYPVIEETFSPIALKRISDWLSRQFGN